MKKKSFNIMDILKIMPHRYPFLLVDKITKLDDDIVIGVKNVTINEPFFLGHFPNNPVMPGVLIIEAMAQVGGFLLLQRIKNMDNKLIFFMMIDKVKFRKPVRPGDQLRSEIKMKRYRKKLCVIEGKAYVDEELVAEGEFTAVIVEKGREFNE
ncbi:3-hydroxyacyl-ACP dehydratase FabZ [candidate division WOR-3 bacterium]|nr:3-hydroxyacyl-ACP dehydratase FabZ [candidate division WOR-3 bacterium]MCK4576210.1 3-hydroxyacyl-ACP dehydratase FabZ [candidate division WOR-3 bacterium]